MAENDSTIDPPPNRSRRLRIVARLRNYFFTGLVIAAPIYITIYLTLWIVELMDQWFLPFVPERYNPEHYLPVSVPGLGLILAFVLLTLLGAFTANLFGRTLVSFGQNLLHRMPVVRNIYGAVQQIFETVMSQRDTSFQDVGLIEYPRKGLWAIVFITAETKGEIAMRTGEEMVSVFLPTTPNPTSGFLLYVPRKDIHILNMTVEEAAKLVISAGLVDPPHSIEETEKKSVPKKLETRL